MKRSVQTDEIRDGETKCLDIIFRLFCGIFGISMLIYSVWKGWQNPSNLKDLDLLTLLAISLFSLYMAADLPLPSRYRIKGVHFDSAFEKENEDKK